MQLKSLVYKIEFGIGRKFRFKTLITSFDHFGCESSVYINCPNVLLQVGFVKGLFVAN